MIDILHISDIPQGYSKDPQTIILKKRPLQLKIPNRLLLFIYDLKSKLQKWRMYTNSDKI